MTTNKGIALSRLLFWSVIFITVAGLSLPLLTVPVMATDSDGDSLSDAFETAFGTDPYSSDSDSDNLSDWQEIFEYGTSPLNPDSDGDGTSDQLDPFPLDDGNDAGGRTTPSPALTSNLAKCPVPSSTAQVGLGLNPLSGELVHTMAVMDFGMGTLEHNLLVATYLSGITHNEEASFRRGAKRYA